MEIAKDAVDIGVYVRDIQACLKFYCEDLGLPKTGELPFPGNRTQHRIQIGSSLLKLMEFHDGAPPAGPTPANAQSGFRYFTIGVRGLAGIVKELEAKGHTFTLPLRESRPGVQIAMLQDPDGNTVELMEQS